jgi:hypothetical protein
MVCGRIAAHLSGTLIKQVFGQWLAYCDICDEPMATCGAPRDFGYPNFKLVARQLVKNIWKRHPTNGAFRMMTVNMWCYDHPPKKKPLLHGRWKKPIPGLES